MDEKQVQKAREWLAKQPDAWDAIKRATSVCDVARLCAAYHESIFWVADTSNALAEKAATELTKTGPLNRFIFSDVKRPILEALRHLEAFYIVPQHPYDYPTKCFLCDKTIESSEDLDFHGLGECVNICPQCGGSGMEEKKS